MMIGDWTTSWGRRMMTRKRCTKRWFVVCFLLAMVAIGGTGGVPPKEQGCRAGEGHRTITNTTQEGPVGNPREGDVGDAGMSLEDLDAAARLVAQRIAEPPLEFDADFENGSLDRVVRLGPDWYHIILRQDTWYRFFFRVKGCAGREIVFEFTCREIHTPGYSEGRGRWYVTDPPSMPLISYDGVHWEPVEHIEKHRQDPGKYVFRHTFVEDEAFVSHHHPYTYSDMLAWLKTLDGVSGIRIDMLGKTRNGFPQPVLTLTDAASSKELVVLICREDADEITANWGVEGLVRALLSPGFQDVLKHYTFKIVPMVGIDGVVAGAHHSAGYGYGGNLWHQTPSPIEIENVKNGIRQWIGEGYRLRMFGTLHGVESWRGGNTMFDGIRTASPALRDAFVEGMAQYTKGWKTPWRHENSSGVKVRDKGFRERWVLDEYGVSEVFETHILGETPDQARRGGEALMHGLAHWLRKSAQEGPDAEERGNEAGENR